MVFDVFNDTSSKCTKYVYQVRQFSVHKAALLVVLHIYIDTLRNIVSDTELDTIAASFPSLTTLT